MRDPFSFGHEFYGDLDCRHRSEEKAALRLKVIEVGRHVCFGGKGGGSAPAPDPNVGAAALKQAEIGQGWLDFATEQFEHGNIRQEALDALNKRVIEQQLDTQDTTNQWARDDRQRYESTFRPLEDMMVLDAYGASNMTDDQLRELLGQQAAVGNIGANEEAIFAQRKGERLAQDNAAAEAKADISSAATQERQATQRQMASMGLNPTSGRYQGVDRAMGTATALASAGAQTNARRGVTADTRAARANAVNVGSGLPASAAGSFGLGLNAGNSATGNALGAEGNWRGNVGIMSQGHAGAMQGYAGMGNTLQQQYNSQLNAWAQQQQANAASSAGLFGALGTGIGAYAAL